MPHRHLRVGDRILTASLVHTYDLVTRADFDDPPVVDPYNPTRIGVAATEHGTHFLLRSDGQVEVCLRDGAIWTGEPPAR